MKKLAIFYLAIILFTLEIGLSLECYDYNNQYGEDSIYYGSGADIYDENKGPYWEYDYCDNSDPLHKTLYEKRCGFNHHGSYIYDDKKTCPDDYVCYVNRCVKAELSDYCKELPTLDSSGQTFIDSRYDSKRNGDYEYKFPGDDTVYSEKGDFCSFGKLYEFYCDENMLLRDLISCEDGYECVNDKCIPSDEKNNKFECVESVLEDKSGNPYIKGEITRIKLDGTILSDEELNNYQDICYLDGNLREYFCFNNEVSYWNAQRPEGFTCGNGRYIKDEQFNLDFKCHGTTKEEISLDNIGSVYGIFDGEPFSYKDFCYSGSPIKFYCSVSGYAFEKVECYPDKYCHDGMCLPVLEYAPVCNDEQKDCGNKCNLGDSVCEDPETLPIGVTPKLIQNPEYEGVCNDLRCLNIGCKARTIENLEYCNGFIKDNDCDGIVDSADNCPGDCIQSLINMMYNDVKIDDYGCQVNDFIQEQTCNNIAGNGENANIVIIPCGFKEGQQNIFYYWSKKIADKLSEEVPFSLESNSEKFSVSYIWDTQKSDVVTEGEIDLTACLHDNGISEKISEKAGCKSENRLIFNLVHRGINDKNLGLANPLLAKSSGPQGWPSCCPSNLKCCINYNNKVTEIAMHEIGHLFLIGHSDIWDPSSLYLKLSNNYYYEDKSYVPYGDSPCPIWNFDKFHYFESILNQKIGCYSININMFDNVYSGVNPNERSLMSESGGRIEFDPVSAKLIDDAIKMGFDKYKEYYYPINCDDFLDPQILDQKDLSYLGPNLDLNGKIAKEDIAKCFVEKCRTAIDSEKRECCAPLAEENPFIQELDKLQNKEFLDCLYFK